MHLHVILLGVILCSVYVASESRQYYPGVGYVSNAKSQPRSVTSARLRSSQPAGRSYRPQRSGRLRDYELIEREELSPARRRALKPRNYQRTRSSYPAKRTRASRRRGRQYRFARQEESQAKPAAVPASPTGGDSPVKAFGGIFPNFGGGLGGVTGGGFAQTNGPGAAFAAGFAQSSGKQSFAGGFGAVINHPKIPGITTAGAKPQEDDSDDDQPSKMKPVEPAGFDEPSVSDEAER